MVARASGHAVERIPQRSTRRRRARRQALAIAITVGLLAMTCWVGVAPLLAATAAPDFGPNWKILDPSSSISDVQAVVDGIANQQVSSQFGSNRYAVLFKPGTYGSAASPAHLPVGHYTPG